MQGSSATASTGAPDSSEAPPAEARTLGKYELLRPLARGGMGEVHLARLSGELGFERRLVIKTIRSELAADPRFVELFAAEAKLAVALSHPNITPIYELGRAADGTLYTAMGWVDGPSLARLLERLRARGRTLELGAALFIARELLDGLAHAHRGDRERPPVVHRDVTPRNVLVDRSGRVQLVDFGIAKPAQTEVAGKMGSVGYMAPEQARGELVDPRADVFAVGCVLFELLTRERAFADDGVWMLPSFAAVPEPARPLLARSLALDPAARFEDAEAFLRALAPVLAEHAPTWASFGARDLAALLAALFDGDWDAGEGSDAAGEGTPATRLTGALQTFATRVDAAASAPAPEPEARAQTDAGPSDDELAEPTAAAASVEPRSSRSFAWPLVALLAAAAGLGGYLLAQTDARREPIAGATPEPERPDRRPELERASSERPDPAPELEPTPEPGPAEPPSLTLEVRPAGARVLLDGVALEGPPYRVRPDPNRALTLELELAGHRPRTVEITGRTPTDAPLRVELEPLAHGSLTVLAPSVAWAEVWLDGSKLGTTPLTDKPVLEGRHKLEVRCTAAVCGTAQVLLERSVRIKPGRELRLSAD